MKDALSRMSRIVLVLVAVLAFAAAGGVASAQETQVRIVLDPQSAVLGEAVSLILEVAGPGAADCEVGAVPWWGADLYVETLRGYPTFGRETVSSDNGAEDVHDGQDGRNTGGHGQPVLVARFGYRLYPLKSGSIWIPVFTVRAGGGRELVTEPQRLTVDPRPAGADSLAERIEVETSQRTPYRHQPIELEVALELGEAAAAPALFLPWLSREKDLARRRRTLATAGSGGDRGTRAIDLLSPAGARETFVLRVAQDDGVERLRWVRTFSFLPQHAGELDLGPSLLIWRDGAERGANARGGNGPGRGAVHYALSPPLELTVRALPRKDRPASFTNGVGEFAITCSAAPRRLRLGDSLVLRFQITGRGNLELLELPAFTELGGTFRIFAIDDGQEPDGSRWRCFELGPSSAAVTRLPALEFAFFDPVEGRYETWRWSEAGVLEVLPGEGKGPAGRSAMPVAPEIATIYSTLPPVGSIAGVVMRLALGVAALAGAAACAGQGWRALRRRKREEPEAAFTEFARGIEGLRKEGVKAPMACSEALVELWTGFLTRRCGLSRDEVRGGDLEAKLRRGRDSGSLSAAPALAAEAARLFRRLDERRYGRAAGGGAEAPEETLLEKSLELAQRLDEQQGREGDA